MQNPTRKTQDNDKVTPGCGRPAGLARPVRSDIIRRAADIVDRSAAATVLESWDQPPTNVTGGLSPRTILIAWVVLALEGTALSVTNVAGFLTGSTDPESAASMGLTEAHLTLSAAVMRRRVLRATRVLLDAIDSTPLPDGKLTRAQYEDVLQWRAEHAGELAEKRARFLRLTNSLLRAQYETLPAWAHTGRASIAIDAHFQRASQNGISKHQLASLGSDALVPGEPDAGAYMSATVARARLSARRPTPVRYGWEYTVAVLSATDGPDDMGWPPIALGIAGHHPGTNLGRSAREVCDDILNRGTHLDEVYADRAYFPHAQPDVLQNHLRSNGAKLVMNYSRDRLGVQAVTDSALLVDGGWYARTMPDTLINAGRPVVIRRSGGISTPNVAERKLLLAQRAELLAARRKYEVAPPTPEEVPAVAGAYMQHHAYGSAEWTQAVRRGGNSNERFADALRFTAGVVRSPQPGLRGEAAHGFLTTLIVVATNAHLIAEWNKRQHTERGSAASTTSACCRPARGYAHADRAYAPAANLTRQHALTAHANPQTCHATPLHPLTQGASATADVD